MNEVLYLSSLDDERFESTFRCEVESRFRLPNGHRAMVVSCDPPARGQDAGFPLGIPRLLLWSRFEDEDLWTFPTFPHFVQICLPDVPLHETRMPDSIAWGELYATEADAEVHEMTERPHVLPA